MQIKQIDILVHPDYYQMNVPYLPLHERQLALRQKWEERIGLLEKWEDAILLYFSKITIDRINQGLKDLSSISNIVEREEVERIKRCMAKLGNRLFLFGWFEIPSRESLAKTFTSRGITYNPEKTKVHSYGEVFEMCMAAWSSHTALSLDIPFSNVEYSHEESLTDADCTQIDKWRIDKIVGLN